MAKTKEKQGQEQEVEVLALSARYHAEGCPMDPDDLEWAEKLAKAGRHAGHKIEIIRCVRCGGQTEKRIDD